MSDEDLIDDPFQTPVAIKDPSKEMPITQIMHSLIADLEDSKLQEDIHTDRVAAVLTSSADKPKSVKDATASGICKLCNTTVWVSPSTRALKIPLVFFCSTCFEKRYIKMFAN